MIGNGIKFACNALAASENSPALINAWIIESLRWRQANQPDCFKVLMERPRRRTLQMLPSEVTSWLKLANKLDLKTRVI